LPARKAGGGRGERDCDYVLRRTGPGGPTAVAVLGEFANWRAVARSIGTPGLAKTGVQVEAEHDIHARFPRSSSRTAPASSV